MNSDKAMINRYVPNAEPVEAVFIDASNIQQTAKWCGGAVTSKSAPKSLDEAYDRVLRVPTLDGPIEGSIGTYLVRDNNGKFAFWPKSVFEEKYNRVALRQERINRQMGTIQPKGWGANSDQP